MADAATAPFTEIRTIANNRPDAVTLFLLENRTMFSIPAKGVWSGLINVPWVGRQEEMNKSITISVNGKRFAWVFQDYNHPNGAVCWSETAEFGKNHEVDGSNMDGGQKSLAITTNSGTFALRMEGLSLL